MTRPLTVPIDITSPERVEEFLDRQSRPIVLGEDAFPTFLPKWNKACCGPGGREGLAAGWTVVLAGMPGAGKSLAGLNLAASVMRCGCDVGYVSLEMSPEELEERFHAIYHGAPIQHLERGKGFDRERAARIARKTPEVAAERGGRLFVNFDVGEALGDVRQIADEMSDWMDTFGVRFFVIDYLQLIGSAETMEIERTTSLVIQALWKFARRRKAVIVALSQYNRKLPPDQRPSYHYLYGGSAIERYSHQIIHLDHTRWDRQPGGNATWIIIDKNRHGPQQTDVPVLLSTESLRIREAMPDEEYRWPK